jgi:general secretion pathway protein J
MTAGNRGFTLVEVLLAMSLSALLLTAVYWTYFSINRSIDAASEGQEALETGRMLCELIKKDIRGVSAARYPVVGKSDIVEGRSLGEIEFVTTAGLETDRLKLRRVGYALITDDKDRMILIRKESKDLNNPLDETAKVFEVSRIISSFHLEFFNGTEWVAKWDSGSSATLPKQIRVTVDVVDAKGENRKFTAEESVQSSL